MNVDKRLLLLCFLFSAFSSFAQVTRTPQGYFQVTPFAPNIVRVKFVPNDSARTEQISDAVILKPSVAKANVDLRFEWPSLVLNNGQVRIAYQNSSDRGFRIGLQKDEKIFGGGERALPLNRRGFRLELYNAPAYGYGEGEARLNYSVPFITSSKGYGLFFNNPAKGVLDIGKANPDELVWSTVSGALEVYVIFGSYTEILRSYHRLTGTQPLPPRWAMGNLMSRFGYTSEEQVQSVLRRMQEEKLPVDAIIFDLFWFGDSIQKTVGNLDWINKRKWPDPKNRLAGFRRQNIQTILVTEPYFVETSTNYLKSKPYLAVDSAGKPFYLTDFYFGKGGLLDIFRNDAKSFFWSFYKKQMDNGVEAWWGDLGEPEHHPAGVYHNLKDLGYKRLFAGDEVHNIYGHFWTKMLYDRYAKEYPNKRLFSLNRSGFAGTQRYSIFPWTGDVGRNWSGLRAQLPVLLGMSMSGVPYVHSDAGGFAGGEGDPELYVRWLQFAAFTPIFRPHGTALYAVDPQAFSYPSEAALIDTPYRNVAAQAIYNRYRLLPYNYTLAYEQAVEGKPLMAPMYYHFADDSTAARVEDQYMWGEQVLVAPVLQKGRRGRMIYLPKGKWYHAECRKTIEGGRWIQDSIYHLPAYFREGAFVTTSWSAIEFNTEAMKGDVLDVFHILSERPSTGRLYSDDGKTRNSLSKGAFELITYSSTGRKEGRAVITISGKGSYAGKPAKRELKFVIPNTGGRPAKLLVNGQVRTIGADLEQGQEAFWDEDLLAFNVSYTGKPIRIEIVW